jgi:exodeoxyribonuclease V alpha subunit
LRKEFAPVSRDALLATLNDAVAKRVLRPLDMAFARFIAECDPAASPQCLLMAALTSRQLSDGHPCLNLDALDTLADEQEWPMAWRDLLRTEPLPASPLLAGHDGLPDNAPLVRDQHRLYLRRYWQYERRVAEGIKARLGVIAIPADTLHQELHRLFPAANQHGADWARVACALAARSAFSVITGGPGTGKTTTVVRLLGLLQTLQLNENASALRIRLAAPTGKAAARLNASIAKQIAKLDVDAQVRASIPQEVETLHRLLGARPDTRRYAYNRQHPLHLDVLVIDEASMIDLEMMAAVLDALPAHARLILLGDKDQLSSVEAGAVLGDLGRRADEAHYDSATATWLRSVSGDDVESYVTSDAMPLDQHIVMLRGSHRFDAASGIGQLAAAVNAGDTAGVSVLLGAKSKDVVWISEGMAGASLALDGSAAHFRDDASGHRPHAFRFYLEHLRQTRPPDDANGANYRQWARGVLDAFSHFQVLCAVRHGPAGTDRINRDVATKLLAAGLIESDRGWYEGRPVMMTRNDYTLGLMNGDVGITLRMRGPDGSLRLYVAFPITRDLPYADATGDDSQVRCVLPSRLGDTETVYAMTVHKSQGSEFEHTALILPDDAPAILTRELLYTGITRARSWLSLISSRMALEQALSQCTRRYSGLAERLS